jgi:enoyl-CoA hydratase
MMTVTTELLEDICLVTLDRPDVRNAVDADTARALHAAFLAFEDSPQAKVAVFHGARLAAQGDTSAVAGLDFASDDSRAFVLMGPSRLRLSKPVIAAVSGAAAVGGMEPALWFDLRVMEEGAYIGI